MTRGAQRFHAFMNRTFTPVRQVPDEHVEAACGRVLDDLRDGVDVSSTPIGGDLLSASPEGTWWRPATVFATVIVAAAIGTVIVWSRGDTVLYRVVDGTVQAGGTIQTNGGGAQLTLVDGSRVEMRSQSELSLERAGDGLRIRLSKGGIIVHAADQRVPRVGAAFRRPGPGHLYVQTKDVSVSVVGTVFLVNAGEEGSRVAVIEGEVRVQHGVTAKTLLPGEQVATNPAMAARPVRDAIAWSRNAAALVTLLQQSTVVPPALAPQNAIEPRETFEVVSVRRSAGSTGGGARGVGGGGRRRNPRPAGEPCGSPAEPVIDPRRFDTTETTVVALTLWAYGLDCMNWRGSDLLLGGPQWIRDDGFDIQAVIPEGIPSYTPNQLRAHSAPELQRMLQHLLADRFRLELHRETREMSVYELSEAQGRSKLTPWKDGDPSCCSGGGPEGLSGRKSSMATLVGNLAWVMGRPVLDRTGIKGEFNYLVRFAFLEIPGVSDKPRPSGSALPPGAAPPDPRSIFTAVEEDLGLRLDAARAPVEVLVIDHVERPSEN